MEVLTCSSPDRKTSHAWPPAWECSETGRLLSRGRRLGRPAEGERGERTQEREGAHGSESRASVLAARTHEDEEIGLPGRSVLGKFSLWIKARRIVKRFKGREVK